jgi:hypothetical protein
MADFADFDNRAFDPDDWEEDIGDDDVLSTSLQDPVAEGKGMSLQQELLQTAVGDYYNASAEAGLTPSLGRDPGKFELVDGRLRLKAYPNLDLVNKRSGRPLALSTLASRGGTKAIREDLGFADWAAKKSSLPAQAVEALQTTNLELGDAAAAVDSVELEDLGQTVTEVSDAVQRMETALTDADIDEILGTLDDPPLNLREIRGLDKALQTIRGELVNNLAKLTELDDHIALERQKLDNEDIDEFTRRRIAERLRDLQEERSARLEAATANREALRSQISRIRETISRILHEDTTLAERMRTLFREQGVTLVSILTAIGMAISTLVLALTGGASGGSAVNPPPPPSDKGGLREWAKKTLQALGRILAKLAGKAAAALPGIIGSIVSWLLGTLGKAAGWLAEHMWALAVAVGGLLFLAATGTVRNS